MIPLYNNNINNNIDDNNNNNNDNNTDTFIHSLYFLLRRLIVL